MIALLRCADWDAPTLLGYEPTYHSFAPLKDKSKMVRKTVDLATVAGEALQHQYTAQDLSTSGLPIRQEQPEQNPVEQLEQQEQPPIAVNSQPPRLSRQRQSSSVGEEVD